MDVVVGVAWWRTLLAVGGDIFLVLAGGWFGYLLGRGRRHDAEED